MMIPKKKETKYDLRNRTGHHPEIKSDRFENVFLDGLIFRCNLSESFYCKLVY